MADATRKLATIVALDVAGYSARTEADEGRTTSEVVALRNAIEAIASRHGGRVFNTAGDGFMLEFGSSLAAVEAAIELAERCEPKVRVGVHLGDVAVQPNGDLLGHGVNVAARLMAQSDPGSVLVSAGVRQTIRGAVAERLQWRGLIKLDKMTETIEAFVLRGGPSTFEPAPSRPSEQVLVVLPFDNLAGDPDMQAFSDGIAEEIMQAVVRGTEIKVIGRSSSFQFRGADKAVARVVAALKVSHLLDGSVRRAGERVRISAQLIEAAGQTTLWSDTYDRKLDDVFAIQDDISRAVTAALGTTLGVGTQTPGYGGTKKFEAFDHFLKGRLRGSEELDTDEFTRRSGHLRQAVSVDPSYGLAWAQLSIILSHWLVVEKTPERETARREALTHALALAPELPATSAALGWYKADERDWVAADEAVVRIAQSTARDNLADGIVAGMYSCQGRPRAALAFRHRARDGDPSALGLSTALTSCYSTLRMWAEFDAEYSRSQELVGNRRAIEMQRFMRLRLTGTDQAAIDDQLDRVLDCGGLHPVISQSLCVLRKSPNEASAAMRERLDGPAGALILLAHIAGACGDHELALEALCKAEPRMSSPQYQLFWLPQLSGARRLAGFKGLLRDAALAQFWRASGKWSEFVRPLGADDFECS